MKINIDVRPALLVDLLVEARENGSGYWAVFTNVKRDSNLNIVSCTVTERDSSEEDKPPKSMDVTPADLLTGFQRLADATFPAAKATLANLLCDEDSVDWDCSDADVILQLTVLGDVVYG